MGILKFILAGSNAEISPSSFILYYNNWDDFTFKTTFSLSYRDERGYNEQIGRLKILNRNVRATIEALPSSFSELSDDFCSLGQELQFYENLIRLFPETYTQILDALNDTAFFPAIRDEFEHLGGFKSSLLRSSEAEKCLKEGQRIFLNLPVVGSFQFGYNCQLAGASKQHQVGFNFLDVPYLPNRLIALIGKNGTGKTQFLAKMALDLAGKGRKKLKDEVFTPHRPLFSKIIAISYSAFDKFSRPPKTKSISYKYCGLKDERGGFISAQKLIENYRDAVFKIKEKNREGNWVKILSLTLDKEIVEQFYTEIFENENYDILSPGSQNLLSSGQSFLLYVITEVIADIRKDSLLLFDEPEMHLHPDAIAKLIRMIDTMLNMFDSFAIVATHSPIILQEIPSRYVNIFERTGNIPSVRKLPTESFGENIEALSEEVFLTKNVRGSYKEVLRNLSFGNTYEEILKLFENRLSLNAKTYLFGLYENLSTNG